MRLIPLFPLIVEYNFPNNLNNNYRIVFLRLALLAEEKLLRPLYLSLDSTHNDRNVRCQSSEQVELPGN